MKSKKKTYIYIYILNYITNAPPCFGVSAPSYICQSCKILQVLKLHKTVDCCMIKSVLSIKCGGGCMCNSESCFGPSSVLVASVALAL